MKICFKMLSGDSSLTNAKFILSEARLGKKYGRMLANIVISDPSLRNGTFPSIVGYYVMFVNSRRWTKHKHNETYDLRQCKQSPMCELLLDSDDNKKINKLKKELDEKYPFPNNINSVIEMEKWSDFIGEKKHKPVNAMIKKLLEQESE